MFARSPIRFLELILVWLILMMGGLSLVAWRSWAPAWVLLCLLAVLPTYARAWRGAWGTGLRSALVWAGLAMVLVMIGQVVALGETAAGGRPGAGHWMYLGNLGLLAALISVFNARRPGGGAWALLMALMVFVLLVPWLEGSGLGRRAGPWERLRLDPPWNLFFGLLALAGVTNYVPTRYGLAALGFAMAMGLEYLGLWGTEWPEEFRGWLWLAGAWAWALAIQMAGTIARSDRAEVAGLERLWAWFRDHWGVVWALRVLERWNRQAEARDWPIRLTWHGVEPIRPGASTPIEAEATLRALLGRFATAERLAEAAGGGPCGRPGQSGS